MNISNVAGPNVCAPCPAQYLVFAKNKRGTVGHWANKTEINDQ